MPPRLSHKKSRKGCQRCKLRKVKCDEERPACSACRRHDAPCDYPEPDRRQYTSHRPKNGTTLSPLGSQGSSKDTASPYTAPTPTAMVLSGPASPYEQIDVDLAWDPNYRRLLELRLMHYFTTVVAWTFPASLDSHLKELWCDTAVTLSFEFPFLMHAILSTAALHAASMIQNGEVPPGAGKETGYSEHALKLLPKDWNYDQAHRVYLNMAVHEQRQILLDLNPSNADAVCLTSMLLSVIAIRLLPRHGSVVAYDPPTQWLSMSKAIATCTRASQIMLRAGSVMEQIVNSTEPNFRDEKEFLDPVHLPPFQYILDFQPPPSSDAVEADEDEETKSTYEMSLIYVANVHHALVQKESPRRICRRISSFGPIVPAQFVTLAAERRPRALVILAYLMAMAKYSERYWVYYGAAEREVYGIQSILPPAWQWLMKWPLEMLKQLSENRYEDTLDGKSDPAPVKNLHPESMNGVEAHS